MNCNSTSVANLKQNEIIVADVYTIRKQFLIFVNFVKTLAILNIIPLI